MFVPSLTNLPFVAGDLVIVKNIYEEKPKHPYILGRVKEVLLTQTGEENDDLYEHSIELRLVTKFFPFNLGKYVTMIAPIEAYICTIEKSDVDELWGIYLPTFEADYQKD